MTLVTPIVPSTADVQLAQIRAVALSTFQASSSVLYWIGDQNRMLVVDAAGPSIRYFQHYAGGMSDYDPLNVERLTRSGKRVATIERDCTLAPRCEFERYSAYMRDSGFNDVLDFVFWREGIAFAGLGLLKSPEDPPITSETLRIAWSMQPYLEFNLARHPDQREHARKLRMRQIFGLTEREIEIADQIVKGLTNQEIADELSISIGTVKTHLLNIFQKTDVSNRTMLSARLR